MTTQSKLQTELSSVDVLNDVNAEAINEAALQSVYSVIDTPIATDENADNVTLVTIAESVALDSPAEAKVAASAAIFYQDGGAAFEYATDGSESYAAEAPAEGITYDDALVDPIFSIMPVDEAIVIDEPQSELPDETASGGADGTVIGEAGEVVDDVLSEDMGDDVPVDPIFSIMPVDEAIVIDESQFDLSDETASGDVGADDAVTGETGGVVDDVLPEDMGNDVPVDPIFSIMPVDDGVVIDDLRTEPSDESGVDNSDGDVAVVVDTVDPEPEIVPVTEEGLIEPIALIKPLIFDWGHEENGDISLDNLAVLVSGQPLASTWVMSNLTEGEMVFSTEEPIPDTVTDVALLGVPELAEFVA